MAPSKTLQDILSMLRVTSGMISGPAMHEVESALTEADIGEDEVARMQTFANDLQKLVQVAAKARKQPRIEYPQMSSVDSRLPAALMAAPEGQGSAPVSLGKRRHVTGAGDLCCPVDTHGSHSTYTLRKQTTPPASRRPGAPVSMDSLPDGTLLHIFATVWSGRPSYNDNDARRQLGDIALVCRQWRDLAHSDELWKPLCIARWPWLKSLKGGPAELLPTLHEYKNQGSGRSPTVWHEFCVRHGRSMSRAGIGRRSNWGSEYSLSVEVFDRKGGFRLFCSYGRLSITSQSPTSDGRWMTKLAITGFASCWHFSASSRDFGSGRFETIRHYLERSHERGHDHCICTEVTCMDKNTGKMAVLYCSSKETKRKFVGEKAGAQLYEEELKDTQQGDLAYKVASGMALSEVATPAPAAVVVNEEDPEREREQKYRVDRLYLIFSTPRRWDVNRIFSNLDWA